MLASGCHERKAAIYHFTNKSQKHPKVYKDQLEALELFAASMGFKVVDVFCDLSLNRAERTEYNRFLSCCALYDALITKDFYHISKNTGRFMTELISLREKGLQVFTMENGNFIWDEAPFSDSLKVATYTCHYGTQNEMKQVIPVRNDVLALFAKKKTNWSIIDQFSDKSLRQVDGEQQQLMKLIKNKNRYDLLLVHNLNDVHWRTSNFCKIREKLKLDIYSLQEGYLKYRKESSV